MEKTVKNKFIKYFYLTLIVNLITAGGMIASIYFFATQYTDYFQQTDSCFWIGYILIVLMMVTISVFVISFFVIWKLMYDYRWRKKQDEREKNND